MMSFAAGTANTPSAVGPAVSKFKCPDCWGGYGDNLTGTSSAGTVTGVSVSLTVPTATCGAAGGDSGQLAAIDGTAASDFAYANVEELCSSGSTSYYATYYNGYDGSSGDMSVSAGDSVTMSVTESAGTYTFTVVDSTSGQTLSGTGSATGASLSYASCINDMFSGVPQANFGTVAFNSCNTTVNGHTGSVGAKDLGLTQFICYNGAGTKPLDKTGKLAKSTGDFTVTFKKAGP